MTRHIVLAGDSVFDNDLYVPGAPGVLTQLRQSAPAGWAATKIAVDGDCIEDVPRQLKQLPGGATDLVLSIGGNDILGLASRLDHVRSAADLRAELAAPLELFRDGYGMMLDIVTPVGLRTWVATIYTAIPFPDPHWRRWAPVGIGAFNQVIAAAAAARGLGVLPLDALCTEARDFSEMSPIEPSADGGQKIVDGILAALGS